MTLTQILQKIRNTFYTKKEIDSMGGGTSLSDTISQKADDSDVVHTSGDETISGVKTFSDTVVGRDNFNIQSGGNWDGGARLTLNKKTENMSAILQTFSNTDSSAYVYDANSFYPFSNNKNNLGTSTNKWKSINGLNPGALSLPNWEGNVQALTISPSGSTHIKSLYNGYLWVIGVGVGSYPSFKVSNNAIELWGYHPSYATVLIPVSASDEYDVTNIVNVTRFVAGIYESKGNI